VLAYLSIYMHARACRHATLTYAVCMQVVKHPSVRHAILCDIDDVVIEQSKAHLKHLSSSHDHEKCQVSCKSE
jgi:hypothetical protein